MDNLVSIFVSDNATASIVAGMLRNNGIHCFVSSDTMTSVFPLADSGVGEVSISVPAPDVERATALLEAYHDE